MKKIFFLLTCLSYFSLSAAFLRTIACKPGLVRGISRVRTARSLSFQSSSGLIKKAMQQKYSQQELPLYIFAYAKTITISFLAVSFWALNRAKSYKKESHVVMVDEKKTFMIDSFFACDLESLCIEYQKTADAVKKQIIAKVILDKFVENYQMGKKLIKNGLIDLNNLLHILEKKDQENFCKKAVRRAWFYDFQLATFVILMTKKLKNIYAKMLLKEALTVKKEEISGWSGACKQEFSTEAFFERRLVIEQLLYDTFLVSSSRYQPFVYSGALGQGNTIPSFAAQFLY